MNFQSKRKGENTPFSVPVHFEGGLQSSVRAELTNELLHYILFERQQIPFAFNQIKREVSLKVTNANLKKLPIKGRLETKKAVDLVRKLEETKLKLCEAFDICPEIQRVAITIGATAVTPKEVFVIQLPPLNPDADNLTGKTCVKTLFRQLIMQDPLGDIKQISPSNISVLIYAPRKSQLSWFYPKPTYKLPVRGRQFEISLQSKCDQGNHDLSSNFSIVELSGFEPFESFIDECEELSGGSTIDTPSQSSEGSITADYICIDSDHDIDMVNLKEIDHHPVDVTVNESDEADVKCEDNSYNSGLNSSAGIKLNFSTSYSEPAVNVSKRMKKSGSASSILSQTSIMSKESSTSVNKSASMKLSSVTSQEESMDVYSLSDTEFIWFQSPALIKGYKCKS